MYVEDGDDNSDCAELISELMAIAMSPSSLAAAATAAALTH